MESLKRGDGQERDTTVDDGCSWLNWEDRGRVDIR